MRFSIIAPNYNEAQHLRTFLSGLLDQTFHDFEVIIVDGGSSDDSFQVLRQFSPHFIKLVWMVERTRNFGYFRNLGAEHAIGEIMFHCNSDNYMEPRLLEKLNDAYRDPEVLAVSGRVYPLGTNILAHVGYQLFDLARWFFTRLPAHMRHFRPSGNFMTIRSNDFRQVGGHPEVQANEDGLLGELLDDYARRTGKRPVYRLDLYVGHYAKKFDEMGGLQALLFYFYVVGNFISFLKPLLRPILWKAERRFGGEE